ncbi:cysteine desulfurase family protein [Desertivirga brevis]|uniref:cysteine desulfurase family protein n=1 Tax=Desertivirga brevis TaxID=2810310 RepID=UPI001A96EF08|nr:cysteine desulfurase family protein [Pedobacter sp. SYSU D00873]
MQKIYLDNAATTPIDPEVMTEMCRVMETYYGNPSSIHAHGREARTVVEKARKKIASLLKASPAEIFFTSGGTEADNLAIRSAVTDYKIEHAITSRIEHHAVLHTLEALEKAGVIKLSYVRVDNKGTVDFGHLEELLQTNSRSLVSLMEANNEIGTLTDMKAVGDLCWQYNAIFHCDTVQTMGHYRHNLQELKVHFITCAGHKFHGPKGVGFIYINPSVKINPLIYGGSQERNMRGGTENLYGIAGLAKALDIAYSHMDEHQQYIQRLKSYMKEQLEKEIEGVSFNGETDPDKSLYTVLNVSFPEMDMADMLLFNMDIAGISCSGGSACSSGTNIGSHVLEGIGASPSRPAIRFSFSKLNTKEEIDYTVSKLKDAMTSLL